MRGLLRIPTLPAVSSEASAGFVSAFAASLTEAACRERYKVLTLATSQTPAPVATAPTPPTPAHSEGGASRNFEGASAVGAAQDASPNLDTKAAATARLYAINARKQAASASAAAARVVSAQSAGGGGSSAGGSAPGRGVDAAADVGSAGSVSTAPVKPISALLQGDFVLDAFTEYVKAPVLPELSREGLWSSRVGDDDDEEEDGYAAGPLDRAALLAKISGAAQTDLEGLD